MIFVKKHNRNMLIFLTLISNISCMQEVPKEKKALKGQLDCDLIWNTRQMAQKEIFFHNTCTNQSCMVVWKSKNILGMWSAAHVDYIPPQGELSYPVYFYDMKFDVDYYFQ